MGKRVSLLQREYQYIEQLVQQLEQKIADEGIVKTQSVDGNGSSGSLEITARTAIGARVESLLIWYVKRATFCKYSYYSCTILGTSIPLAVTIINTVGTSLSRTPQSVPTSIPIVVSVLSGLACLISAWLALSRCQENWIRYRSCAESMKEQAMLYLGGIDPYVPWSRENPQNPDNDRLLVQNMEKIVANENQSWKKMWDKNKNQNNQEEPGDEK